MGQKHKRSREFRTPFSLRDIHKKPRSNVRACAAGDGAFCTKNRKFALYHGANPNTRNGARLWSLSMIIAPGFFQLFFATRAGWIIGEYINNSRHLARKYARIFVLGYYLFRFSEQIISKDKHLSIFSPQMEAIVFIILQIVFATRAIFKIGEYSLQF